MNSTAAFVFQSIAFIASFNYRVADYAGLIGWSGNAANADVGIRLGLHGTSYILPGFTANDFDYTGVFFANGVSGGTVYNGSLAQIYESGFNGLTGNYVGLGNYAIETNRWWFGNVMELALYQYPLITNDQQAVMTDQARNWNVSVSGAVLWPSQAFLSGLFPAPFGTNTVVLSVRLVVQTYKGPLIQVRRSNDSATTNIYPSSTGDLNTVTLLAFTGPNSAYISIWYDQSGGQFNAIQATTSNQPQIVASGVVITLNGQPAPTFSSSSTIGITSFTDTTLNVFASAVFSMSTLLTNDAPVFGMSSGSSASCYAGPSSASFFYSDTYGLLSSVRHALAAVTINGMSYGSVHAASFSYSGSTIATSLDGSSISYTATSAAFATSFVGIGGCTVNPGFVGSISEIVLTTNVPTSTQQAELLATQQVYWSIPTITQTVLGITTPIVVLSIRLVVQTYTGPLIQVRRSNDSATTNIYPSSTGDLNTVTLLAFTGSNSAYISIWYDQSGGQFNAVQATSSSQPQIVASGVVITKNGQPAPTFTSSSTMGINGFTDTTNNVFASSVFSMSTGPQNYYPVFGMSSGSSVSCYNNVNDIGFFFSFTSGQLSALRQGLLRRHARHLTRRHVDLLHHDEHGVRRKLRRRRRLCGQRRLRWLYLGDHPHDECPHVDTTGRASGHTASLFHGSYT
jgi:hypothetical protein